jgi:holo-[acyl-carrier protein] synthase
MITGIGCDIAAIPRFERWALDSRLASRFFHADELSVLARPLKRAAESLAARFAAKEAFAKALGTGFRGFALRDVCVIADALGKPSLALYGAARERLRENGADAVHLSLSHDGGVACAFVVLEKRAAPV